MARPEPRSSQPTDIEDETYLPDLRTAFSLSLCTRAHVPRTIAYLMPFLDRIVESVDGCHKGRCRRKAEDDELCALQLCAACRDRHLQAGIDVGRLHRDAHNRDREQQQQHVANLGGVFEEFEVLLSNVNNIPSGAEDQEALERLGRRQPILLHHDGIAQVSQVCKIVRVSRKNELGGEHVVVGGSRINYLLRELLFIICDSFRGQLLDLLLRQEGPVARKLLLNQMLGDCFEQLPELLLGTVVVEG